MCVRFVFVHVFSFHEENVEMYYQTPACFHIFSFSFRFFYHSHLYLWFTDLYACAFLFVCTLPSVVTVNILHSAVITQGWEEGVYFDWLESPIRKSLCQS